jgi:hypothetical protein
MGRMLTEGERIMSVTAALIAAIGLMLITCVPALAHHSFAAEYDVEKPVTLTGFVTKLDWTNPHAFLFIDFKDESGAVKTFRIEMGPPYALVRGGWKRDSVKIGDKITVEGAALAKDGSNSVGATEATAVILATGEKLAGR